MCKYNIDWGSVPAWLGLAFSVFGSIIVWKNYTGEKKKRRLALRPFFTFSKGDFLRDEYDEIYAFKLKLTNIGEIAILKGISSEFETEPLVIPKLGYEKGSTLELKSRVENVNNLGMHFIPKYAFTVVFEDIEGNIYSQTFKYKLGKKNVETLPMRINEIPKELRITDDSHS